MSNGSERSGRPDGFTEHDPWAPPGSPPPARQEPTRPDGPSVADQHTVTSMPSPAAHPPPHAAHVPPPAAHVPPGAAHPPPAGATPPGPPASGFPAAAPYGQPPGAPQAYGPTPYTPAGYGGGYATGPYPAAVPTPGHPGGAPVHGWAPPALPPSNGLGTAGMVLGIVAACLTATIVGFALGLITGVLAVVFGAVGRARVKRGVATNGAQALAGLILGVVAFLGSAAVLTAVAVEVADRPDRGTVDDGSGGDTYNARPPAVVRVLGTGV
ncbi:DUF4190 domain-containing protein [Streptomyces lycii]|uniref:DUF4190 domain-containing protein n=1 Tax=Streptomyces lycii TaxID=2654337 RepID=A0ABQ7FGG5_9ACTN|nr:DUF4190 domain-containing protein [Streptomyces lycii]KAF4407053.1 DUF4190 domain-containing protein [Streptomyces lycii]